MRWKRRDDAVSGPLNWEQERKRSPTLHAALSFFLSPFCFKKCSYKAGTYLVQNSFSFFPLKTIVSLNVVHPPTSSTTSKSSRQSTRVLLLFMPSHSYAKRQYFYLDTIVVIHSCDADNLFKLWLKSLHCESNVPADLGLDLSLKTAVRTPSHHPHHRILLLRNTFKE